MENTERSQLEFFSEGSAEAGLTQPKPRIDLLGSMRSHEKKILFLISFLIIAAISFSLGVEKGKHIAPSIPTNNNAVITVAAATAPKPALLLKQGVTLKPQPAYLKNQPLTSAPVSNLQAYTVQIASYLNRNSAENEATDFRKRGLAVLILSKGKYSVLCVGNFSSRESAQLLLSELKKQRRYQDCTIRRL